LGINSEKREANVMKWDGGRFYLRRFVSGGTEGENVCAKKEVRGNLRKNSWNKEGKKEQLWGGWACVRGGDATSAFTEIGGGSTPIKKTAKTNGG